jgi:uncharacterized protein (DUF433 family)
MTPASNGQPGIIRTERGLTIAGTRITLYDVMDYVSVEYPPKFIRGMLNLTDEQVNAALSYRIITQLLNFYKVIKRRASTCPAIANAFDLKVKFAECFRLLLSNVTGNLYPSVERTHFFSPTVRSVVGYHWKIQSKNYENISQTTHDNERGNKWRLYKISSRTICGLTMGT